MQLLKICGHSPFEARALFTPFWGSIAPIVVRNLDTRPLVAQRMCELLNQDLASFLVMTEKFTIPYLILIKKRNILEQIVNAHGPGGTMMSLFVETANLTATLAYLLLQSSPNVEGMTIALLQEAMQPEEIDYLGMLNCAHVPLTVELLKIAGERDETTRTKVGIASAVSDEDSNDSRLIKRSFTLRHKRLDDQQQHHAAETTLYRYSLSRTSWV